MENGSQDDLVIPLTDPLASNLKDVGGKAANLARLTTEEFPVPEGICVTTAVYQELVDEPTITSLIDALDQTEEFQEKASELRHRIRDRSLPVVVREAIEDFLIDDKNYVVRSSATAEDLPHASFAGQHDTILGASGPEEIFAAVSDCMASLFTDRAISYRRKNGIAHDTVSMAVVIQRMIDADVSGVLFTADPLTGNRKITSIDAASGLGEDVVSGTLSADNIRVNKSRNEIISYRHGGIEDDSDHKVAQSRLLKDELIQELSECGKRIEELFESPQDIEWSIENGDVWMLQARPITSLFPLPTPTPDDDGLHIYYSYSHRQGMTEAMPPLSIDFSRKYIENFLDRLTYRPASSSSITGAGGRLYLDLTPLLRSSRFAPKVIEGLREVDEAALPLLHDIRDRRLSEFSDTSAIGGRSLGNYLSAVWKLGTVAGWGVVRIIQGFLKRDYEQTAIQEREWYDQFAERSISEIREGETEEERIRKAVELSSEVGWPIIRRQLISSAGLISKSILQKWCSDCEEEFEALSRGLRHNVTTRMMLELGDLADIAREDHTVAQAIIDETELSEIRELEEAERFIEEFDAFIERYGFRGPAEIDPSKPRYREDPSPLIGTIRSKLQSGDEGSHWAQIRKLEADAEKAIESLEEEVESDILGRVKRPLVEPLAKRYRGFMASREIPKYGLSQLWAEVQYQIHDAGDRLVLEDKLDQNEDVWLLEIDELLRFLESPNDPPEIDFEARRVKYRAHRNLRAPRVITSDGEIPQGREPEDEEIDGFVGNSTSTGVAEGIARVVHDPSKDSLRDGEIMVAPYTDPGWTPLFLNAAGLVLDVGGEFSHGSLVAREYGIPSVVVVDATQKIESGQRLRVDGNRGVVEFIEDEA